MAAKTKARNAGRGNVLNERAQCADDRGINGEKDRIGCSAALADAIGHLHIVDFS